MNSIYLFLLIFIIFLVSVWTAFIIFEYFKGYSKAADNFVKLSNTYLESWPEFKIEVWKDCQKFAVSKDDLKALEDKTKEMLSAFADKIEEIEKNGAEHKAIKIITDDLYNKIKNTEKDLSELHESTNDMSNTLEVLEQDFTEARQNLLIQIKAAKDELYRALDNKKVILEVNTKKAIPVELVPHTVLKEVKTRKKK